MWDQHWCKSATTRVAEMAPRMNEVIARLRDQGVLVIHCPSETMEFYQDHPARRRAMSAPAAAKVKTSAGRKETPFPIVVVHDGCTDDPPCRVGRPWKRQIPTLEIKEVDAITDDGNQVYNLMRQRGAENLIIMGVHTNMCVLGRSFGIKAMVGRGANVALMRDMTDTMYCSEGAPQVDHFAGTDLVIEWIERNWCSTLTSDEVLGGKPFHFAADKRPRGVGGEVLPCCEH
jgi:nicotinamidase-related amidase